VRCFRARWAYLTLVAFLLEGCVQFNWSRVSRNTPIGVKVLAQLEPGTSELTECLQRMGAPLLVLETDDGQGAILLYVWHTENNRGFRVSLPVSEYASADFDYDLLHTKAKGAMLFFDGDWLLRSVREGQLLDLTNDLQRRRPALMEG